MSDLIERQVAENAICNACGKIDCDQMDTCEKVKLPTAQPDIEKICTRIKAETIKRNVEYMKRGERYMLGFVDGMRLARRIVDGTIDDPVYFTRSGE